MLTTNVNLKSEWEQLFSNQKAKEMEELWINYIWDSTNGGNEHIAMLNLVTSDTFTKVFKEIVVDRKKEDFTIINEYIALFDCFLDIIRNYAWPRRVFLYDMLRISYALRHKTFKVKSDNQCYWDSFINKYSRDFPLVLQFGNKKLNQ